MLNIYMNLFQAFDEDELPFFFPFAEATRERETNHLSNTTTNGDGDQRYSHCIPNPLIEPGSCCFQLTSRVLTKGKSAIYLDFLLHNNNNKIILKTTEFSALFQKQFKNIIIKMATSMQQVEF